MIEKAIGMAGIGLIVSLILAIAINPGVRADFLSLF